MTAEPNPNASADPSSTTPAAESSSQSAAGPRPAIKIGSQREPGLAPSDARWAAGAAESTGPGSTDLEPTSDAPDDGAAGDRAAVAPVVETSSVAAGPDLAAVVTAAPVAKPAVAEAAPRGTSAASESAVALERATEELFPARPIKRISAELQAEIDEVLGDLSLEELLKAETRPSGPSTPAIELDQKYVAQVIKCDRESVFVTFGGQQEGIASLKQFPEPPAAGTQLEVVPTRFLVDDNLYEVVVPGSSISVQDWSDLSEGVIVEARVSGHNKGGLECEVNRIRGFMPISQVSMYRVEDLEPFVGQTLQCLVTECNPDRRNLVLSHRAMLERERQQNREKLLTELAVGQIREGVVRRLQDFGAFVDIGGVDGLIHVSQLSWERVKHPSEVLEEGQRVKVRVEKIDPATGKIGLSYRDLLSDPWAEAQQKFSVGSVVEGVVSKLMDFGAFVRLAAGVEGLVHISEVASHRVHTLKAFLKEGQTVLVKILSLDPESKRISLSIKAAQAVPASDLVVEEAEEPEVPARVMPQSDKPLKGGLGRGGDGERFGLKW